MEVHIEDNVSKGGFWGMDIEGKDEFNPSLKRGCHHMVKISKIRSRKTW